MSHCSSTVWPLVDWTAALDRVTADIPVKVHRYMRAGCALSKPLAEELIVACVPAGESHRAIVFRVLTELAPQDKQTELLDELMRFEERK